MKAIRSITILAFAIIVMASVVGCAPKQPAGPVTVRVLSMEQAGPTVDEMNAIVGEFNQANPDIKVEI
jgi:ABC-type glycerol-3-phosphate transport system substrate-binding protein